MDVEAMERESDPDFAAEDDADIATAIAIYSTKVAAASSDGNKRMTLADMLRDVLTEHAMAALSLSVTGKNKVRTTSAGSDDLSDDASETNNGDNSYEANGDNEASDLANKVT
jgi:hypothetical protein